MNGKTSLLLTSVAALLAGCVSSHAGPNGVIQTTSEANRSSVGGAVAAPLRDVNVLRTKIPNTLLQAAADPYARPDDGCAGLTAEVRALDITLGPDLDAPQPQQGNQDKAEKMALGVVAGTAQDVIPFRSWVRRLTGAERHDRLVTLSITAGRVRRAYLKGLGESRSCNPPATPSHVPQTPDVLKPLFQPTYPVK